MFALQIAKYLEDQSIGIVASGLYAEFLPDTPDNAIAVFSTGGFNFDYSSVLSVDDPTFQIRVRNTSQLAAYNKALDIYNVLQGLTSTTLDDGTHVIGIQALQSEPANIGRDAAQRPEYTINYTAKIYRPTNHRR